jgi:hypothetical protein
MIWVLVWTVLVLGALGVLALIGRRLWGQTKALTAELRVATDRLAEVSDRLSELEAARRAGGPPR